MAQTSRAHFRCSHGEDTIKTKGNKTVKPINHHQEHISKDCETCAKAKMSRVAFEVRRDRATKTLWLGQTAYILQALGRFGLQEANSRVAPLETGKRLEAGTPLQENTPYRAMVGTLLYLSTKTRPDIAHAVGMLTRFMSDPTSLPACPVLRRARPLRHRAPPPPRQRGPQRRRAPVLLPPVLTDEHRNSACERMICVLSSRKVVKKPFLNT